MVGSSPLFQDGDIIYQGIIFREIPEMDTQLPVHLHHRRRHRHQDRTGVPVRPVNLDGVDVGPHAGADLSSRRTTISSTRASAS